MNIAGCLKRKYELRGRDWLRTLPAYERQAFSGVGRFYAQHGHLGGVVRAATAKRDGRGRFMGGG